MPQQLLQVPANGRLIIPISGSNNATRVFARTRLIAGASELSPGWGGLFHRPIGSVGTSRAVGFKRDRITHPGGIWTFSDYPFWTLSGYPGALTTRENILVLDLSPQRFSHVAIWVALGGSLGVGDADIATWS